MERLRARYRWGAPPWWLQGVVVVPEVLAGLLPLVLVARAYRSPEAAFAIVLAMLVLWALLSGRRAEALLARWTLRLRLPSPSERERLQRLLGEVLAVAGSGLRPTVLIHRSKFLNALAYGRHTLAVTDVALALDDRHLRAVLAHELGHLEQGHTMFGTLRMLSLAPLRLYREVGGFLLFSSPFTAVLGLPLVLLAAALALPIWAADVLYRPVARWEERSADLYAADVGYGEALAEVLYRERPGRLERFRNLLGTHPDGHLRAMRLMEAVRSPGRYRV